MAFINIVNELLPLYLRGDIDGIVATLSRPENIIKFIEFVTNQIGHNEKMLEVEQKKMEYQKKIADTLEKIEKCIAYAPEGLGYDEVKNDFEKLSKKRKMDNK